MHLGRIHRLSILFSVSLFCETGHILNSSKMDQIRCIEVSELTASLPSEKQTKALASLANVSCTVASRRTFVFSESGVRVCETRWYRGTAGVLRRTRGGVLYAHASLGATPQEENGRENFSFESMIVPGEGVQASCSPVPKSLKKISRLTL